MKVRRMFEIEVEFNPSTDEEAVATALDRLLETALSTPGITDDYGGFQVGEFLPIDRAVEKVLVLSTAHMPVPDPQFGSHVAIKDHAGYIVYVAPWDPSHHTPEWLEPVAKKAGELDRTLIKFRLRGSDQA